MARLTAKSRNKLSSKSFAGPDRSYPIEDASHARNALSRVSQFGSPELKSRVRAAVHRKYPSIGDGHSKHYKPEGADKEERGHHERMQREAREAFSHVKY